MKIVIICFWILYGILFGFSIGYIFGISQYGYIWYKKIVPVETYSIDESTLIGYNKVLINACANLAEQVKTQNDYIAQVTKQAGVSN